MSVNKNLVNKAKAEIYLEIENITVGKKKIMLIRDEYLTCKCSFNKSITVLLSKHHYTTLGFQALLNLLWEQIKEMSVCDESLDCS